MPDCARMAHHVLVTGGSGFVGASLCCGLADRHPGWRITALDNLKRRGSELNLPRLKAHGVGFVHGDVRAQEDLLALDRVDAIVECSAEPSALAGVDESPDYLVQSNLVGAYHCLELARRDDAQVVFMSTSRVYPYRALDALAHTESATRFELDDAQALRGASGRGIAEDFPLEGPRTLYGATKLAAELLVTDYAAVAGIPTVIDRCGVIAGPWQMGKVDQGVFTFWVLAHQLGRPLRYIGYGGAGKQVRDLLHVEDLVELIDRQLGAPDAWRERTVNVGGGREVSLSLAEATTLCAEITGNTVAIGAAAQDRPGDVRVYLSDCTRLYGLTDWRPSRDAATVIADTAEWIRANESLVVGALG
jgi:CDP-paratose 2-epimerase